MSTTTAPKSPIFSAKAAFVMAAIFLGVFAVLTLRAVNDRAHRPALEQLQTP